MFPVYTRVFPYFNNNNIPFTNNIIVSSVRMCAKMGLFPLKETLNKVEMLDYACEVSVLMQVSIKLLAGERIWLRRCSSLT